MATNNTTKSFLCGVVEGFYGRPWTTEQRIDLFNSMSRWTLNCYVYAPKDDDKHRATWRELYTLEEADHLAMLVRETHNRGVEFVYAIAPGLDITFSDEKDVLALKRKLEQLSSLGCTSFAILFDDIDPELSLVDSKVFTSAADAQASLTNDLYSYLREPQIFLFCPTEYCGNRASPNVCESPYLRHLGETLKPAIDILWTGPKVISKSISVASIKELTQVLQRAPVIWDNLHANDYDQRRLFLGPYQGRSTSLYEHLNGVLTNPNCEYGANYVAIHTLAQWKKCGQSIHKRTDEGDSSGEEGMDGDPILPELSFYNPSEALNLALLEWLDEFHTAKRKPEDYLPSKDMKSVARATEMEHSGSDKTMLEDDVGKDRSSSAGSSDMDTTTSGVELTANVSYKADRFALQDLHVLVDLFYLPHAHGDRGQLLLEEFSWLKQNAPDYQLLKKVVGTDSSSDEEEVCKKIEKIKSTGHSDGEDDDEETLSTNDEMAEVVVWLDKASRFHTCCEDVNRCFERLTAIPNRPLLYDLYHYMSDVRETTMLLDSYIAWLEAGGIKAHPKHQPHAKMGGIVAEMLKLLPQVEEKTGIPSYKKCHTYVIRPYRTDDKDLLYQTCLETGDHGEDATYLFPNYPDLLGDRYVGPYLHLSSGLCYILEDDDGVCGYVLGILDSQQFYDQFKEVWLPQLLSKYPPQSSTKATSLTLEKSLVNNIHNLKFFLPDALQQMYPSHLHIDLMKRAQHQGNGHHMMRTMLSLLSQQGSHGVHLEMSARNKRALKFYMKLGFKILDYSSYPDYDHDVLILGRSL